MTAGVPAAPDPAQVRIDVQRALAEDLGAGDASASLVAEDARARAHVLCREQAVLAGQAWFDACLRQLDPDIAIDWHHRDGAALSAGTRLCTIEGRARAMLSGERTGLNFLQTLSATATVTARHVAAVAGTRTRILDTRKTLPGLRVAQKYAVRCGGGSNHRMGLFDAVLVKENHISAAGSIVAAVQRARRLHPDLLLEIEVENLDELERALSAGVDRVMLDEFDDATLSQALACIDGRAEVEVSGSVSLERLRHLATLGIDYVSIGALTKNIRAVDLSMRFDD